MCIRITHETATEAINGTDLIYEHHSKDMSLMRIAAIQTSPPNSRFRFPTCTAFVKATNRLQGKDPAGISIGYYVPACRVKESWSDGKSVNPNTLEGEIVT